MEMYPPFDRAPVKVRLKLASFGDVHEQCFLPGEDPCRKCQHLLVMAYQCFYGHITSIGEAKRAISTDLFEERR